MKKHLIILIILFINYTVIAQTKPKQKAVEKRPTQKEMGDMMKEMQQALDEMSPEDKKAMEDMGIKMPDVKDIQKNISGVTDAQKKKAYEDESRIVPQKDGTGA